MSADTLSSRPGSAPALASDPVPVAGVTPFTTIDYPGRLAAVFYTQGCAWSCRYCHNAHLRPRDGRFEGVDWRRALDFLKSRRGLLEAVVFSGGEPTLHAGLSEAMRQVKAMGFLTGLHTAGMDPQGLERVLAQCDWVGMDLKAPLHKYETVTGVANSGGRAYQSARLLIASGRAHEFRTTVHPDLLDASDLEEIGHMLYRMGAQNFVLQRFRPIGCRDESLCATPPVGTAFWTPLQEKLSYLFAGFHVRG